MILVHAEAARNGELFVVCAVKEITGLPVPLLTIDFFKVRTTASNPVGDAKTITGLQTQPLFYYSYENEIRHCFYQGQFR